MLSVLLVVLVPWTWLLVARRLQPDRWVLARPRTLWDLVVVLIATAAASLVGAALRAWGMGLLPTNDVETFLLLLIRNYSGILGPVGVARAAASLRRARLAQMSCAARSRRAPGDRPAGPSRCSRCWPWPVGSARSCSPASRQPLAFTLVLVVVWAAFRIPPVAAVLLALALGTGGVVASFRGTGQFRVLGSAPFESAAIAQGFLITLVLAALAISIDVEQRRTATLRARSAEQVAESRARLFSTVVDNLDEGVTVITADDDYTLRNRAARRLTGVGGFLRPDPDDAGQPQHGRRGGRPDPAAR